jgi:hypothetical protein
MSRLAARRAAAAPRPNAARMTRPHLLDGFAATGTDGEISLLLRARMPPA